MTPLIYHTFYWRLLTKHTKIMKLIPKPLVWQTGKSQSSAKCIRLEIYSILLLISWSNTMTLYLRFYISQGFVLKVFKLLVKSQVFYSFSTWFLSMKLLQLFPLQDSSIPQVLLLISSLPNQRARSCFFLPEQHRLRPEPFQINSKPQSVLSQLYTTRPLVQHGINM